MADVLLYNVLDEQYREDDADGRKGQKQIINTMVAKTVGQEIIGVIQSVFQSNRGKPAANPNYNT